MKRGTKMIIFALVLIALAGGYWLLKSLNLNGGNKKADTSVTVSSVAAGDIKSVSWAYADQTPSFTYDGTNWVYDGDVDFPVKQSALTDLVSKLTEVKASQTVNVNGNSSEFGLDKPGLTVSFTSSAGTTYKYVFGDTNSVTGDYYAEFNDDGTKVYTIGSDLPEAFQKGLYDMLRFEEIPDINDVSDMTVTSGGKSRSIVHLADNGGLSYSSKYTRFYKEDGQYLAADDGKVRDTVSLVKDMVFGSCANYRATDADLKQYGLDKPAVTVIMDYTDVKGNTGTVKFEFGGYNGQNCYVRMGDSRMVYLVKASVEDTLALFGYSNVEPADICLMDWDTVDSMDIFYNDKTYSITLKNGYTEDKNGKTAETRSFFIGDKELDASAGQKVLDAIYALKSTGKADAGGRGEKISFTFHRSTATFRELTLTLYMYDSSSDLVGFNGQKNQLVSASDVDKLIELVNTMVG